MIPVRRRKMGLIFFILFVLSLASGLDLYALRQNINLFYSPSEVATGKAPMNQPVQVGGMVEKGSIVRDAKGLGVQFKITDFDKSITVMYEGILPDLFREGQGIVAKGHISDRHTFQASEVLAKHDANYMPPQVKTALAQSKVTK